MDLTQKIDDFNLNNKTTIVGIRHAIGLFNETYWLDQTLEYLDRTIKIKDKIMLEIPEYPLTEKFRKYTFKRDFSFFELFIKELERREAIILPAEDKEKFYYDYKKKDWIDDLNSYLNNRDKMFIEKIENLKPKFFYVGAGHITYLKEYLIGYNFVNLVNEEEDKKIFSWLRYQELLNLTDLINELNDRFLLKLT